MNKRTASSSSLTPPQSSPALVPSFYLAVVLGAGVVLWGMVLGGTWATGVRVQGAVSLRAPLPPWLDQQTRQELGKAFLVHLGMEASQSRALSQNHWRWEAQSVQQRRQAASLLGLEEVPAQAVFTYQATAAQVSVQLVVRRPRTAAAQIESWLRRTSQRTLAQVRQGVFQRWMAAHHHSQQRWQSLLRAEEEFRRWLKGVLGESDSVAAVAYWRWPVQSAKQAQGPQGHPDSSSGFQGPVKTPPTDTIEQLRRRIAQLEAQDAQLAVRLTPLHPERKLLLQQLARLRAQLAQSLRQAGRTMVHKASQQTTSATTSTLLREHLAQLRQFQDRLSNLTQQYIQAAQQEAQLWQYLLLLDRPENFQVIQSLGTPQWIANRRNGLLGALAILGATVALGALGLGRRAQRAFATADEVAQSLGVPAIRAQCFPYLPGPVQRLRQRLFWIQRGAEALLVVLVLWVVVATVGQQQFAQLLRHDPLLALACLVRMTAAGVW